MLRSVNCFLIGPLFFFLVSACTPFDINAPEYRVSQSLPQSDLENFNDSFDDLKEDKWSIQAVPNIKPELRYLFKPAEVIAKNGALEISTRKNYFGAASLSGTFFLIGNFDVQVDFRIDSNPMQYKHIMLAAVDETKTIYKMLLRLNPRYESFYFLTVTDIPRNKKRVQEVRSNHPASSGEGTFRIIKVDRKISFFYRKMDSDKWVKLNEEQIDTKRAKFALNFANRFPKSDKTPKYADVGYFYNFKINAAQQIEESDI